MKALRDVLDKVHPLFAKGGILEVAYPMYEALDTFLYTPGEVASGKTHVRDGIDLKRMMITVVMALVPSYPLRNVERRIPSQLGDPERWKLSASIMSVTGITPFTTRLGSRTIPVISPATWC